MDGCRSGIQRHGSSNRLRRSRETMMPNTHGSFIWYELLTSDPDTAGEFYSKVLGWTVRRANMPNMDYRFFFAGKEGIGGHMRLPDDVPEAAKRPVWLGYVGVDDVDAVVDRVVAAGGSVRSPATDHEGVGRMAMVADPQGVGFYVMRGASDEESNSFSSRKVGIAAGTSSRRATRRPASPSTPGCSVGRQAIPCRWGRWATINSSTTAAR